MGESVKLPMRQGFGATDRIDAWWKGPTAMAIYLGIMIAYSTWRGFMEADFWIFADFGLSGGQGGHAGTMAIENQGSHVLSPLFSPLIIPGGEGLGGPVPGFLWWMSPAMFILIFPAGFRGTCYYYRKAYYRVYMQQPTACAVSKPALAPWKSYKGETKLLVIQNLHRYFMYAALAYLPILSYDVLLSTHFEGGSWGFSIGTLVLALNVILLSGYTLGCHAFRHLVGGGTNDWTSSWVARFKYKLWSMSSFLNVHHKDWALFSLFWVMFADFYIYACTMDWWTDIVLWGGL
ncbi:MAG: succinate dehydrogenase [Euryarchaeota archaeon]|nr:succinate dehydrogenase [Euryarchaeota archaeon]